MFERYTEKARRVIFFARYEASQFGSPFIETEHLLLGLLREDPTIQRRFLRASDSLEKIRRNIEANLVFREKISTSVDLPLSNESKRVLAYSAEEAERLGHKHIGTEHLLLGLLREEKCFAALLLHDCGLRIDIARQILTGKQEPESQLIEAQPDTARTLEIQFVDEKGDAIFRVPWTFSIMLPRTGEYVMFPEDALKGEYRVGRVTYHYQRYVGESTQLHDRLAKIEITLTKVENGTSAETS